MLVQSDIEAHYKQVLTARGYEAAESYLLSAYTILRIANKPSAPLVESALHMANVETFNAMRKS